MRTCGHSRVTYFAVVACAEEWRPLFPLTRKRGAIEDASVWEQGVSEQKPPEGPTASRSRRKPTTAILHRLVDHVRKRLSRPTLQIAVADLSLLADGSMVYPQQHGRDKVTHSPDKRPDLFDVQC